MTLKLKTPTKRQPPDSLLGFGSVGKADARELLAIEVAARDAQWLELVGPVVEVMKEIVDADDEAVDALKQLGCAIDQNTIELTNKARAALRAITEEQE